MALLILTFYFLGKFLYNVLRYFLIFTEEKNYLHICSLNFLSYFSVIVIILTINKEMEVPISIYFFFLINRFTNDWQIENKYVICEFWNVNHWIQWSIAALLVDFSLTTSYIREIYNEDPRHTLRRHIIEY